MRISIVTVCDMLTSLINVLTHCNEQLVQTQSLETVVNDMCHNVTFLPTGAIIRLALFIRKRKLHVRLACILFDDYS